MQDLEAANVRPLGGFELEEEITEALEVRRAALCVAPRISFCLMHPTRLPACGLTVLVPASSSAARDGVDGKAGEEVGFSREVPRHGKKPCISAWGKHHHHHQPRLALEVASPRLVAAAASPGGNSHPVSVLLTSSTTTSQKIALIFPLELVLLLLLPLLLSSGPLPLPLLLLPNIPPPPAPGDLAAAFFGDHLSGVVGADMTDCYLPPCTFRFVRWSSKPRQRATSPRQQQAWRRSRESRALQKRRGGRQTAGSGLG